MKTGIGLKYFHLRDAAA